MKKWLMMAAVVAAGLMGTVVAEAFQSDYSVISVPGDFDSGPQWDPGTHKLALVSDYVWQGVINVMKSGPFRFAADENWAIYWGGWEGEVSGVPTVEAGPLVCGGNFVGDEISISLPAGKYRFVFFEDTATFSVLLAEDKPNYSTVKLEGDFTGAGAESSVEMAKQEAYVWRASANLSSGATFRVVADGTAYGAHSAAGAKVSASPATMALYGTENAVLATAGGTFELTMDFRSNQLHVVRTATEDGVPVGAATYVDPSDGGKVKWCATYEWAAGTTAWEAGKWYVAEGEAEVAERIKVSGSVNLILADGAKLVAKKGIRVNNGASLTIWGQKEGSGRLEATGPDDFAGIGGEWYKGGDRAESCHCGAVTINGGVVVARGGEFGAGIGGSDTGDGGVVTVNGGVVEATGQEGSAGIGGGDYGNGGEFTITGGKVTATGSTRLTGNKGTGQASAGIGAGRPQIDKSDGTVASGDHLTSGKVTIRGGEVVAKAGVPSDQAAYHFADPAQAMGVNVKDADYNEANNANWLALEEVAVYTSEDAEEPVLAGEREAACRGTNVWVRTCPHRRGDGLTCVWCGAGLPPELPGKGTEEEPYLIGDYKDLKEFALVVNAGNVYAWGRLTNGIAATGTDWTPIGTDGYYGTFDGDGHTIRGLSNEGGAYAGLFVWGYGTVRNVRLEGASIKGGYAGGIVGRNEGTVSNCCVIGSVSGTFVGGVVGHNYGTVANCWASGSVSGDCAGGITCCNDGVVTNCYGICEVSGWPHGGVVGENSATVANSYCLAGPGVVGDYDRGTVSECRELRAEEFRDAGNFEGWDFENVWAMGPERPLLRVFGVPSSETVGNTTWYYWADADGGTNATVAGAWPAAGDLTMPGMLDGRPVVGIGEGAFEGCGELTGLRISDGVESVGAGAFEGCTNLATVWVPVEQAGTGLLDAAGLPEGCEIRYYGTQVVTFEAGGGACATVTNAYAVGEPYGWLPVAEWDSLHEFEGWRAANGGVVTTNSIVTGEAVRMLVARWKTMRGVFITEQPEGRTVQAGDSVTFSVGVRNQAGFTCMLHWLKYVPVEMLFCPAGTFEMGSPESEEGRGDNETRHTVTLTQDFWLSRTEITQEQFYQIMATNPSSHQDEEMPNLPADSVDWHYVGYFCRDLTANEKSAGRLPEGYVYGAPTEAQWEYACRAGTTNALASGEDLSNAGSCPEMDQVGWYKSNSVAQTHVVGTIWTNAWGFCDMHGNVSEWCWDWYQAAYPTGTVVNPAGPGMPVGDSDYRVLRGGDWNSEAHKCRSAARGYDDQGHGNSQQGFRLALVRSRDVTVPLADGLRLQLTAVNPDTFQMGSPDGELGRNTDETRHAVTLTQVYWIGKYEVTQAQWLNVMGDYPAAFTTNSADPAFHGMGDDFPVYATSHAEAVAFCERLTERERAAGRLPAGYRFALPTEAQWEYACRGGTTKALNNDHDLRSTTGESTALNQVGWYAYNAEGTVHSIDSDKEPNNAGRNGGGFEFGASMSHMHGNVQEWVADWYGEYPGGGATEPEGPASGTERILRGGGITDEPPACRSAARTPVSGGAATETSGFRVAIVPVKGVAGDPDALYPPKEPGCLTGGVAYQWYRDGVAIEGATGATLSIDSAALSDAGRYTVTVTAVGESATSAEAVLEVAEESETVDGVEWWYVGNGEGAKVVAAVPAEGDLTMPETLGGAAVTVVGAGAFQGCTNLTGLTVADGVTDIGDRAFENCGALTNVWLGAAIGSVGAGAFAGCTNLATVWVPAEQAGTGLLDAAGLPEGCQVIYRGGKIRIMAIGVGSNAVSLQFDQDASTVFGTDDLMGEWKALPSEDFTLEGTKATIPLEKAYRFLRAE